jgi:hypothetical protein
MHVWTSTSSREFLQLLTSAAESIEFGGKEKKVKNTL